MAFPGPFEIVVLLAIFLFFVGLPLAIIAVLVVFIKRRSDAQKDDDTYNS